MVVGDADALRRGCETSRRRPRARSRVLDDPREATNDPGTIEVFQAGPSLADVPFGELDRRRGRRLAPLRGHRRRPRQEGGGAGHRHRAAEQGRDARSRATSTPATPSCSPRSSASRTSRWCSPPVTSTSSTSPPTSRCRTPSTGVTPERTDAVLQLVGAFTRALGRPDERIGVAGLNPHAGRTGSSATRTPTSSSRRWPGPARPASTCTARCPPMR